MGLAVLLAVAMYTPGCATTGMTPAQQTQLIDDTAVLIHAAARNGAMFAIEDDPNTAKWFALAQQSIATFLTGTDYSPAAFQAALNNIPLGALKSKWIKYALYNVVDLYQLYYGRYVQSQVQSNEIAKKFLEAVQDGFKQALEPEPSTP